MIAYWKYGIGFVMPKSNIWIWGDPAVMLKDMACYKDRKVMGILFRYYW